MSILCGASAGLGILLVSGALAGDVVTSVTVPGSNLQVNLATRVGQPFDSLTVAKDVRYLWSLGRFQDIRVETEARDEGVAITFCAKTTPIRLLHEIRIEPDSFGLKMEIPRGTLVDDRRAHDVALEAQRQLNRLGYASARVRYEVKPAAFSQVDLKLNVEIGDAVRVKRVQFEGPAAPLHTLRARRILFWRLLPSYSQEAVDGEIARIQSSYLAKGFLNAVVRPGPVEFRGNNADVTIVTDPGPQHVIDPGLCGAMFEERREAQLAGILDFAPALDEERGLRVERGPAYRVGRIEFTGNHHYKDAIIRSNFVLNEGELFDERRLRRSVANLNRTSMFENIEPRHVIVEPNEKTGTASVTVRLTERKRGAWNLSGPVGPASLAGPLEGSISSRLPPWGRGLLELSTYTASISMLAFSHPLLPILNAPKRFTPIFALQRPYVPGEGWKSGFLFAPQLGWKDAALGYGTTQVQQRLLQWITIDRSLQPDLNVTVTRAQGEATLSCEPPRPKLFLLRQTTSLTLRFLGNLTAF